MLNATVTNITSRHPFPLWLLRVAVRLCGAEIRLWRTRPRKEKGSGARVIVQPPSDEGKRRRDVADGEGGGR